MIILTKQLVDHAPASGNQVWSTAHKGAKERVGTLYKWHGCIQFSSRGADVFAVRSVTFCCHVLNVILNVQDIDHCIIGKSAARARELFDNWFHSARTVGNSTNSVLR